MSVKAKYGTGFKYGNSWKYGYGTSEPWIPSTGAARFTIDSLTDPVVDISYEFSSLMYFSAQGVLSIKYPGYANEVFYLTSPNGTRFRITNNGTTGAQSIDSGFSGTPNGIQVVDPVGMLWTASISDAGILSLTNAAGFTIETSLTTTYTPEVP